MTVGRLGFCTYALFFLLHDLEDSNLVNNAAVVRHEYFHLYPINTTQNNRASMVQYGSAQLLICCLNAIRTELNRANLTVLGPPNVATPAWLNTIAVTVPPAWLNIHVTNLLELQVMLPRPFDAIVQQSRYNDGGIRSDHHEKLLSCVWQGRRARYRKELFRVVGLRDRIAKRLSHLSGLTVMKEDLSEFACREVVHQSPQTNSHANTVSACSGIAIIVCRCKVST